MSTARARLLQLLLIGQLCAVACAAQVRAAGWLDNFNDGNATDGNPVTWLEDLGGSGFFPGSYDASSGDYVLDPAPGSPTGQMSALVPGMSFTDTYMRLQGIVLPDPNDPTMDGGNLVLTARIDPQTVSGYLVYFDVSGNLNIQTLIQGQTQDIGTTFDAPFNAGSEVVVEFNVVGNQLSAYAWLADDPAGKPAEPQVMATDDTFTSGIAGIAFAEDDPGTIGVFRYAAAQSTPFVDTLPGDFTGDGKVDTADYVDWRNGPAAPADYQTWRANFGTGAGAAAGVVAVPEPASLVLWLTSLFVPVVVSRRRLA